MVVSRKGGYTVNYVDLGSRIRLKRLQLGWTQEGLAKRVGLSTSFIGHIERGSRKASLETLVNISNAMDISMDELLSESLEWKTHKADIESLIPGQRNVLHEVLTTLQETLIKWDEDTPPKV